MGREQGSTVPKVRGEVFSKNHQDRLMSLKKRREYVLLQLLCFTTHLRTSISAGGVNDGCLD
jgi:hypothetical protein